MPAREMVSRERARNDQSNEFTDAWTQHAPELFQRCLAWMGGNRADADEAFSRLASTVFLKFSLSREVRDRRAWLLRLAYNICMDLHRERKRRGEHSLDEIHEAGDLLPRGVPPRDPERRYLAAELTEYLQRCIRELPPKPRDALRLRLRQLGYPEIARQLGIEEPAARKRVQLARQALQHRLEEYLAGQGRLREAPRPASAAGPPPSGETPPVGPPEPLLDAATFHPVVAVLPSGIEKEAALALHQRLRPASDRQRRSLESYIELHPAGYKKRLELARVLAGLGRTPEAVEHYRYVVARQPRLLHAWHELADLLHLLERPEELARLRQAAPEIAGAAGRLLRGALEARLGRRREAGRELESARLEAPASPAPLVALGELSWHAGRPADALQAFDAALDRKPDSAAALTLSHDPLEAAGLSLEARRRAARALDLDGGNHPALVRLVEHRCRAGLVQGDEGEVTWRFVRRLLRLAGERVDAQRCLALFRLGRGQRREAERGLAGLAGRRPNSPQAWMAYAGLLSRLGEARPAAEALRAGLALPAPEGPIARELALAAAELLPRVPDLAAEAMHALNEAERRFPDDALVLPAVALGLARLPDQDERARDLALRATVLQPRFAPAWLQLGRVLTRLGRKDDPGAAAEALQKGLDLMPREDGFLLSAPAALLLAETCTRLGDVQRGREQRQRAADLARSAAAIDPARALAWQARAGLRSVARSGK